LTFDRVVGNLALVRFRLCVVLLCLSCLAIAPFPKWKARSRAGVMPNRRAAQLIDPALWRDEPPAPSPVDLGRFQGALANVCGLMPKERNARYAAWILESAQRHGEDPFLLAAVVHRMTRCDPLTKAVEGLGLAAIQPEMYQDNVFGRVLRYQVPDGAGWAQREKTLPRPLTPGVLGNPQDNLEWAAALLSMWREQHGTVDSKFEQAPHRHYVSHFIWGDHVESSRAEDRVFTDRRRLLMHYGIPLPTNAVAFRGVPWGCPLEAGPRVVSSTPGASREEGLRRHRGVDVESVMGEPVLAMADGVVTFAGVDMPGQGAIALTPSQFKDVPRRGMGAGGRFVCIDHAGALPEETFLRSCYMHLEDVRVRAGDTLQRGSVIGSVGRTGMKSSAPHLHLEIKSDRRLYDARDVVPGILLGEPPPEPRRKTRSASAPAPTE
jgi:murein DD-endopeptidase MepM/ murein hydrolase activator NlpD